jgi:ribosomal protein S12 methylthiotransferase accessory factor YcaO
MTPDVPALNPHVEVHRVGDDLLIVVGDHGARALAGTLLPRIVPLVDGRRSIVEIAAALEDVATLVDVSVSIDELADEGVLAVRPSTRRRPPVEPLVTSGAVLPCWDCLPAQLREGLPIRAYLQHHRAAALTPPFVPLAATSLVQAAVDPGNGSRRPDALRLYDSSTHAWTEHAVARRSDCSICAAPSADLMRHVRPITGIVGAVSTRDVPGAFAHIAVVDHVFPPEIEDAQSVWRGFRRRSMAGGISERAARDSAVGEAVERYSGVFRPADAQQHATFAELGAAAIHPNDVMGFSDAQLRNRLVWNAAHPHPYTRVPEPFDPHERRAWTAVVALQTGGVRWLPTASCFYGVAPSHERRSCVADSNGCAAGPSFEAAVVSGFLELIERDAVGIWWHNRIDRPGIDLTTVNDPFVQAARTAYERIDRDLRVLDITTDIGVPAFAAVSSARGTEAMLTLGFGAHFDPLRALRHALIEMSLFLPELAAGRRRVICSGPEPAGSYLWPMHLEPWSHADAIGDVSLGGVAAVASAHALDVFVLDQTRAGVNVPVARVIVPGLCHFWARYQPARLYAVPVAMRWLARARNEADLNESRLLL